MEPSNAHKPLNRQIELMQAARAKTSFDSRKLTFIIYGGEEEVLRREEIFSRVQRLIWGPDDRKLPHEYGELDRTGLYHHGLRIGKVMLEEEITHQHHLFVHADPTHGISLSSPFGLYGMFIKTLQLQGDTEQQAYWLPLIESGEIIGTYCQTEMGHGTFLRGLETTVRFDPETDEFILHSPTLTSTKYWTNGLGFSTSHAIVMARLIIHEKDYGVHAFIVQLRSTKDWKLIPGIELGEIGLKMGMNGSDNGYLIFHQARIPRRNMLMGQAKVATDGMYTSPSKDYHKHSYSTLIYTRCTILPLFAYQLAKAVTIAIRYSTVREQGNVGFDPATSTEIPIISFKSQHYRLLVGLSQAYAILFSAKELISLYEDLEQEQRNGNSTKLAPLHAISAGLKAYTSQVAADSAEDARRCCGGHGYLVLSGLPHIVADLAASVTFEGDNYVMYQQTARYLVKQARAICDEGGRLDGFTDYLKLVPENTVVGRESQCPYSGDQFLDNNILLEIFRYRSARNIFNCENELRLAAKAGRTADEAWNRNMMNLIMAARSHAECFVLEAFVRHLSNIQDHRIRTVMERVCNLYALSTIESPFSIGSSSFFESGYISTERLHSIRNHLNGALDILLPEAIGLTDAWNFSDASLRSALGRKDGNVYEVLLEWTRQLPINIRNSTTGGIEKVGYENYIRPIVNHSKL